MVRVLIDYGNSVNALITLALVISHSTISNRRLKLIVMVGLSIMLLIAFFVQGAYLFNVCSRG